MNPLKALLFVSFSTLAGLALKAEVPVVLSMEAFAAPAAVLNSPVDVHLDANGALVVTSPGRRNLFCNPSGSGRHVDAPMVLFPADEAFVLTTRVSAPLRHVYDVAAIVVYEDENTWAKLCFENSVDKTATVVSVINRGLSDDCNGPEIGADFVYYAVARKGSEYAFHWSKDGVSWHLFRHFSLETKGPVRIGFAVHGISDENLTGTFSEIRYIAGAPKGMRTLKLP